MPLQLLNLGVIVPRFFLRMFHTRTPRGTNALLDYIHDPDALVDFAELNAPPVINYGVVYPQTILMFVIIMLYSVVQPLIVIFGAIYFGVGYIVYKYKLLFGMSLRPLFHSLSQLRDPQCSTSPTNLEVKLGLSHSTVSFGESLSSSSS